MKPDKNVCLNCGKQISSRAKYCSDKCTKAYKRNSDKRSDKPNSDTPNIQVGHELGQDDFRASLTKTDKTFYDRAMREWGEPYYNFDWDVRENKCDYCGASYKTKLRLNRYCSYQHYTTAINP